MIRVPPLLRWTWALVLFVSCFTTKESVAVFTDATKTYGLYVTHVLSSGTDAAPTARFIHVSTAPPSSPGSFGSIFIVELDDFSDATPSIIPEAASIAISLLQSRAIVTGPKGCDAVDPQQAFITSNCANTPAGLAQNQRLVQDLWFLNHRGKDADECLLRGGDERSCFGPMFNLRETGYDAAVGPPLHTDLQLLSGQRQGVEAGLGYNCAVPSFVQVDMVGPALLVTTNCVAPTVDTTRSFAGPYVQTRQDTDAGDITVYWRAFARNDGQLMQMRVLITRMDPLGDTFVVQLGVPSGNPYSNYTVFFTSFLSFGGDGITDWGEQLPMNIALAMFAGNMPIANLSAPVLPAVACNLTLGLQPAPDVPTLRDVYIPSDINWVLQPITRRLYASSPCGYRIGTTGMDGRLVFDGVTEGEIAGGFPICRTNDRVPRPWFIPPNPRFATAYPDNCDRVFAPNATFRGVNIDNTATGVTYTRAQMSTHRCFAPLYNLDAVAANTGPFERNRQCAMMKMTLSASQDVCWVELTKVFCETNLGFIAFGSRCFLAMEETSMGQYASGISTTDGVVAQITSMINAQMPDGIQLSLAILPNADIDMLAWLRMGFLAMFRRGTAPRFPYRIQSSAGGFLCYSWVPGNAGPSSDAPSVNVCSGESPAYPILYYEMRAHEVVDQDILWPPQAIQLWKYGQKGQPWAGQACSCQCFAGWGGAHCWTQTCFPASITSLASSAGTTQLAAALSSPVSKLAVKCIHGTCKNGQARSCICLPRWGPSASLVVGSPFLPFVDAPCNCPASSATSGTFSVNNATYVAAQAYNLPCGGTSHGACLQNSLTGVGFCQCVERPVLDPDSPKRSVAAWGGPQCVAKMPNVPPLGYVVNSNIKYLPCNDRGILCPGGTDNSLSPEQCFNSTGGAIDGCMCLPGFTGEACTCPSPLDIIAAGSIVTQTTQRYRAYAKLGVTRFIARVIVSSRPLGKYQGGPSGCTVNDVRLGSTSSGGGGGAASSCGRNYEDGREYWDCSQTAPGAFVIVETVEAVPRCRIEAYDVWFPPCGNQTNPTAGRFPVNELNFVYGSYVEEQPAAFAGRGCTNWECMCASGYTGPLCNAGVSAMHVSSLTGLLETTVCGENGGRGVLDTTLNPPACSCSAISSPDGSGMNSGGTRDFYVGDACEHFSLFVQERGEGMICAGHGDPVPRRFPYGTCVDDLETLENDALFSPRILSPGVNINAFLFTMLDRANTENEIRSVVVLFGRSWLLGAGSVLRIPGLFSSTTFSCMSNSIPWMNMSVVSLGGRATHPAVADVEIWTFNTTTNATQKYVTTCDPGVLGDCPAFAYCRPEWIAAGYINPTFFSYLHSFAGKQGTWETFSMFTTKTCIGQETWKIDVAAVANNVSLDGLAFVGGSAGNDTTASVTTAGKILCANAFSQAVDTLGKQQFGTLQCNTPTHRVIDSALLLFLGDIYQPVCAQNPITRYSNVLGAHFGLWWRGIIDLPFSEDQTRWTPEHYAAVSSFVNNERWFDAGSKASIDLLDQSILDAYDIDLVNGNLAGRYIIKDVFFGVGLNDNQTMAFVNDTQDGVGNLKMLKMGMQNAVVYSSDEEVHFTNGIPLLNYDVYDLVPSPTNIADKLLYNMPYMALLADSALSMTMYWSQMYNSFGMSGDGGQSANETYVYEHTRPEWRVFLNEPLARWIPNMTAIERSMWRLTAGGFVSTIMAPNTTKTITAFMFSPPFDMEFIEFFSTAGPMCGRILQPRVNHTYLVDCLQTSEYTHIQTELTPVMEDVMNKSNAMMAEYNGGFMDRLNALTSTPSDNSDMGGIVGGLLGSVLGMLFSMVSLQNIEQTGIMYMHYAPKGFYGSIAKNATLPKDYIFAQSMLNQAMTPRYNADIMSNLIPPSSFQMLFGYPNLTYAQAWSDFTRAVVHEHRWPFNAPLRQAYQQASATRSMMSRPIDLSSSEDQDWLFHTVWGARLAPRRPTNDAQCRGFSRRGGVTFVPDADVSMPWRNGDPDMFVERSQNNVGDEGGCEPHFTFRLGFWSGVLLCGSCAPGYGPSSQAAWLGTVDYQSRLARTLADPRFQMPYSLPASGNRLLLYVENDAPFAALTALSTATLELPSQPVLTALGNLLGVVNMTAISSSFSGFSVTTCSTLANAVRSTLFSFYVMGTGGMPPYAALVMNMQAITMISNALMTANVSSAIPLMRMVNESLVAGTYVTSRDVAVSLTNAMVTYLDAHSTMTLPTSTTAAAIVYAVRAAHVTLSSIPGGLPGTTVFNVLISAYSSMTVSSSVLFPSVYAQMLLAEFNALLTASNTPSVIGSPPQQLIDALNSTLYCRLPWDETAGSTGNPLCSGHGTVRMTTSISMSQSLTLFRDYSGNTLSTPACASVVLNNNSTRTLTCVYKSANAARCQTPDRSDVLMLANGGVYWNSQPMIPMGNGGCRNIFSQSSTASSSGGSSSGSSSDVFNCDFATSSAAATATAAAYTQLNIRCYNPLFVAPLSRVDLYDASTNERILLRRHANPWLLRVLRRTSNTVFAR